LKIKNELGERRGTLATVSISFQYLNNNFFSAHPLGPKLQKKVIYGKTLNHV